MAGRVLQGCFLGGRPLIPAAAPEALQPKAGPRLPSPPPTAFAPRAHLAQLMTGPRPPGPPVPAFPPRSPVSQRRGTSESFALDPWRLGLVSGGGRAVPEAARSRMEAALGADFSAVRVHVGPQAERIGAIAFTVGNDIYFAPGRFQPDTIQGKQLLGHELAHVMQQRQGRVRSAVRDGLAVVQDRVLEAEAERLAQRAVRSLPPAVRSQALMASPFGRIRALQRMETKQEAPAFISTPTFNPEPAQSGEEIQIAPEVKRELDALKATIDRGEWNKITKEYASDIVKLVYESSNNRAVVPFLGRYEFSTHDFKALEIIAKDKYAKALKDLKNGLRDGNLNPQQAAQLRKHKQSHPCWAGLQRSEREGICQQSYGRLKPLSARADRTREEHGAAADALPLLRRIGHNDNRRDSGKQQKAIEDLGGLPAQWNVHPLSKDWGTGNIIPIFKENEIFMSCNITYGNPDARGLSRLIWAVGSGKAWITLDHYKSFIQISDGY